MKTYRLHTLSDEQVTELCRRPNMNFETVSEQVRPIIERVRKEGDKAVRDFTLKYDGIEPDPLVVDPTDTDIHPDEETREAIDTAFQNIYRFHKAQLPAPLSVETMPGISCRREARPIERVGLYVPGGTARLPSTLMMLGIPAAIAGCRTIVIATPPGPEGAVSPEILYIAGKIGGTHLLNAGGAQAVAAMAFGTDSVPKVDKIFGPGNQYVTAAKMMLQNSEANIAIDMPAGPSEVLVIADGSADPSFVAADLLSQAEHGKDSQVVLAATGSFDLDTLNSEIEQQLEQLPRREIARGALNHSFTIITETAGEAIDFSNRYAPEHLIIHLDNASGYIEQIRHAGSVFIGPWSPESVGDYASGTNHTLPTYGYARMYSGLTIDSFMKFITFQELDKQGLKTIAPTVEKLAELEGLQAHKHAVTIRKNNL